MVVVDVINPIEFMFVLQKSLDSTSDLSMSLRKRSQLSMFNENEKKPTQNKLAFLKLLCG
jgi:hypothetical protein